MSQIVAEKTVDLAAPPDRIWPGLSDTDRINRRMGLGSLRVSPNPDDASPARFVVETEQFGFAIKYEEYPFEWEKDRSYRVRRRFMGGPLEGYTAMVSVEPKGEGSRVSVRIEMDPRYAALRPLAWAIARVSASRIADAAVEIDEAVRSGKTSLFSKPASGCDVVALGAALERLAQGPVSRPLAERLAEFVATAPDADCVRMRPFELADLWGLAEERDEIARVFLHAVVAGLLELRWSLVCPSCRTSTEDRLRLDEVGVEGHCRLCEISFGLDLDRAVEATFIPHPSVRQRVEQFFCVGGPGRTPHVVSQVIVPKAGTSTLRAPNEPGRYRIFVRGGAAAALQVQEGAEAAPALSLEALPAGAISIAPGAPLALKNEGEARHVKIEATSYADQALTAHYVSTIPDFRRIFSSELLKAETPLRVARVALLFSDLVGSTALYATVGDAAAFRLVDDHFDVLRKAIEDEHGVIVKTMGDAVMASFPDARACARAGVAALKAFEAFRATREHGARIGLKLGMHVGPCYAVTANGALDYFGQTVNVAARVQGIAGSSELVLSRAVFEELEGTALERMRVTDRFSTLVKGVEEPIELVRLVLTGSVPPPA